MGRMSQALGWEVQGQHTPFTFTAAQVRGSACSKGEVQNSGAHGNLQEDKVGQSFHVWFSLLGDTCVTEAAGWGSLLGQGIPSISRGGGRAAQAPMAEQNGWRCGTGVGAAGKLSRIRIPAKEKQ